MRPAQVLDGLPGVLRLAEAVPLDPELQRSFLASFDLTVASIAVDDLLVAAAVVGRFFIRGVGFGCLIYGQRFLGSVRLHGGNLCLIDVDSILLDPTAKH